MTMNPVQLACRMCGCRSLDLAFELTGMPQWNHRLLRACELGRDRAIDLPIYSCPSCGFVSAAMNLAEDYYEDYVNVPSLSAQARQFQIEQASEFVTRFGLGGRKVLEIGCGDGFFLHALRLTGAAPFGIEPSTAQRQIARQRGLDVEEGILTGGRLMSSAPFDAFVTRQVFEHVEDMRDFLTTIRANLRPEAVGLVEVPNLDKLVSENRFFDFIPEHINYFTPRTLDLALRLAGYEVLEICPVDSGESLRALVRWRPLAGYQALARHVETLRSNLAGFLGDCKVKGLKVAIWGAGGKGLSMMAVADLGGVDLLVDSNPAKIGLFTPVSHLRVAAPTELAVQGIDVVIVMAPAFEREIAEALRTEMAFSGEIVLAGSGFERLPAVGACR